MFETTSAPAARRRRALCLDPRVKLALVCLNGLAAFALFSRATAPLFMGFVAAVALLHGLWRPALGYCAVFAGLYVALYSGHAFLYAAVGFLGYVFRFCPLLLAAAVLYKTTPVPLLVAALRKMGLPAAVLTPLCVVFRFFPSVRQDVVYITQSMRTRSVGLTPARVLLHPVQSYEFLVVPVLMRVLTTAEELAAASETRGLGYPCPKTSLHTAHMRAADYGFLALFALFYGCIAVILLGGFS